MPKLEMRNKNQSKANLNELDLIAGKHDQNIKEEGEFSTAISEIYLHPQYNPGRSFCIAPHVRQL